MKTNYTLAQVLLILFASLFSFSCNSSDTQESSIEEDSKYLDYTIENHNARRANLASFLHNQPEYVDTQTFFDHLIPLMQYQDSMRIALMQTAPSNQKDSIVFAGSAAFEGNYMNIIKNDVSALFGIYVAGKETMTDSLSSIKDSILNSILEKDLRAQKVFNSFVKDSVEFSFIPLIDQK